MGQQVAIVMSEDDVRNDLLKRRIVFDLASRLEEVALANDFLVPVEIRGHEPVPRRVREDVFSPDAEDLLGGRAQLAIKRTSPRPKTAISSAVRSISSSRTGKK